MTTNEVTHAHIHDIGLLNMARLYAYANHNIKKAQQLGGLAYFMVPNDNKALSATLWSTYLQLIPEAHRGHFVCSECRRWFDRFSSIQVVTKRDALIQFDSLCWDTDDLSKFELSPLEISIVRTLNAIATATPATQLAFGRQPMAIDRAPDGQNNFQHFHSETGISRKYGDLKTADEHRALRTTLSKFIMQELDADTVRGAGALFRADVSFAGFRNYAQMMAELERAREEISQNPPANRHMLLSILATTSLVRVRGSVLGTFLLKLKSDGLVAAKGLFKEMVDPTQYRKPSALPHSNQVELLEGILKERGLTQSINYRPALVNDPHIPWIKKWDPIAEVAEESSLFAHLKTSDAKPSSTSNKLVVDAGHLTYAIAWEQYLSKAQAAYVHVSERTQISSGIIGVAIHPEAPPILRYDLPDNRCPVSCLMFDRPAPLVYFGFNGSKHRIVGIAPNVADRLRENSDLDFFVLASGASDTQINGLLPAILPDDLHDFWRVLHHHNQSQKYGIVADTAIILPVIKTPGKLWANYYGTHTYFSVVMPDGLEVKFVITTA